ncbi:MAG: hypothetical protein ACREBC_20095 [Pyrinomonadaceae bacterium]
MNGQTGTFELDQWKASLRDCIGPCLRDKGLDENTLDTIAAGCFVSGIGGIAGILACLVAAGVTLAQALECYNQCRRQVGAPPYDETMGSALRGGDGYLVSIDWRFVNRTWPIDNDTAWTIRISNRNDDPAQFITSVKLCFKDDVEDLFAQTQIPSRVFIQCGTTVIDTTHWNVQVKGKCLIFEVEEGLENLYAVKKDCFLRINFDVEADGTTTLGTTAITIDRGKNHSYHEGVTAPGPVLAAAFNREGAEFLAANSPSEFALKPQFAHIPPGELVSAPLTVLPGISEEQSVALATGLGIRTIRDLVLFRRSGLYYAAKRVLRTAAIAAAPGLRHAKPLVIETDIQGQPPKTDDGSNIIVG